MPVNKYKKAMCEAQKGCLQRGDACLTFKVMVNWLHAGIAIVSDLSIRGKLCKVQENYQKTFKLRTRKKPLPIQQDKNYIEEIENTFNIRGEKAHLIIYNDPNRTE